MSMVLTIKANFLHKSDEKGSWVECYVSLRDEQDVGRGVGVKAIFYGPDKSARTREEAAGQALSWAAGFALGAVRVPAEEIK